MIWTMEELFLKFYTELKVLAQKLKVASSVLNM